MNAETPQPRPTLNLMWKWECDSQESRCDELLKAGLPMRDAMRLVRAGRISSTLCALVTLMERDSRLKDTEANEDDRPESAALNDYLRGGLEEAIALLVGEINAELCSVGKRDS